MQSDSIPHCASVQSQASSYITSDGEVHARSYRNAGGEHNDCEGLSRNEAEDSGTAHTHYRGNDGTTPEPHYLSDAIEHTETHCLPRMCPANVMPMKKALESHLRESKALVGVSTW